MAQTIVDFLMGVAEGVSNHTVSAGFINGANYPDGTPVAEVAAKNEYGDPLNNQPPRPFFRNAISADSESWKQMFVAGLRAGHPLSSTLEIVGETIASDIRKSINELWNPELSALTIAIRQEHGNYSVKPLLDTRWMYDNVTYTVEKGADL